MPWVDRPQAIVEAYLGGQGGGAGVVDVLYGAVNPGAKLAETFPLRQSDAAADAHFPGEGRQVQYREGLYVGYRWFDTAMVEVLFPFGHGLSYTTFDYSDLEVVGGEVGADDSRRVAHGRGHRDQHRRRRRVRGGPALRARCRVDGLPAGQGAEGLRQGPPGAGRSAAGAARARPALLRLLGHRVGRLAGRRRRLRPPGGVVVA